MSNPLFNLMLNWLTGNQLVFSERDYVAFALVDLAMNPVIAKKQAVKIMTKKREHKPTVKAMIAKSPYRSRQELERLGRLTHICLCGKKYASRQGLKSHAEKCQKLASKDSTIPDITG